MDVLDPLVFLADGVFLVDGVDGLLRGGVRLLPFKLQDKRPSSKARASGPWMGPVQGEASAQAPM